MSFFDESEQPTRAQARPARPRRPATGPRGPGGGPPDRQTARTRQAVALGVAILLLILIVLGVKGCLDSRHDSALKDYNRDATAVVKDSDGQVGAPFFKVMSTGSRNPDDLKVQVNQLRLAADEDVKRAEGFDVPGDMKAAQRNLELVLNLRADALRKIADQIPSALGRGQTSTEATSSIAAQMQSFLASDVVYSQRVAPLIKDALDKNDIGGQRIATSRFLPSVAWLSPQTVSARLTGSSGATGQSGQPAPGLHGHSLLSTSVGSTALSPTAPGVVNRVPASSNIAFTVKFSNAGDNSESNVKISLRVKGGGKNITQTKTIDQTKAHTDSTVSIPLGQAPPVGVATTVTVAIGAVPGETKTDNNRSEYTVIFTQ